MATQYIVNDKGEKTAVIVPINEYENLLHQHHQYLELTDEYKLMIDDNAKSGRMPEFNRCLLRM